jgi:hypothetical protein
LRYFLGEQKVARGLGRRPTNTFEALFKSGCATEQKVAKGFWKFQEVEATLCEDSLRGEALRINP